MFAGPTVAAAGLILAGTFASLMLGGSALLTSMGFAISFGIFVAAFVMAMFFTPALTALIGHAAWWPGHGDRRDEPAAQDDSLVRSTDERIGTDHPNPRARRHEPSQACGAAPAFAPEYGS